MVYFQEMVNVLSFITLLKPVFSRDGDTYCFLFGDNTQGIAGFGDTPWSEAVDIYKKFMGVD